jgi:hypothetical protein
MTHEAEFLSGDVMERHWQTDEDKVALVAVSGKNASPRKKEITKKPKCDPSEPPLYCGTKKTCP